jgi:UDP-N-acetylmuramyl pentapeptide phosphotransferase/UDP-N-acetylglucosamine-1-phosphate transferase
VARTAVLAGLVAGAASAAALRRLRSAPPSGAATWDRTNHAGATVTLLEGPAWVAGSSAGVLAGTAVAGSLVATAATAASAAAVPGAAAPLVATMASGALGALDDLTGDSRSKGLKGHLGALARGEVTTGAVKVLGLAVTGLATAALVDRARSTAAPSVLDTLLGGAVVAGSANLLNLLDLRPGRALKATVLAGALLATDPRSEASAGAAVGAAAGLMGPDLAGESMLGDTGANSAGALLGTALLQRSGRRGRVVALTVLAGLTLASERVSFTKVIESTPGLRELDALGRQPVVPGVR